MLDQLALWGSLSILVKLLLIVCFRTTSGARKTRKGQLKQVQHLYPTFSCHVWRNLTECWMKILIVWKDCIQHSYPTFFSLSSIHSLFSKWQHTRVQLWWSQQSLSIQMLKSLVKGKRENGSKVGEKVAIPKHISGIKGWRPHVLLIKPNFWRLHRRRESVEKGLY